MPGWSLLGFPLNKDTHPFTTIANQLTGCWLLRRSVFHVGAGRAALTAHGDTYDAIASDHVGNLADRLRIRTRTADRSHLPSLRRGSRAGTRRPAGPLSICHPFRIRRSPGMRHRFDTLRHPGQLSH